MNDPQWRHGVDIGDDQKSRRQFQLLGRDDAGAGSRGDEDDICIRDDGSLLLVGFAVDRLEVDTETFFRDAQPDFMTQGDEAIC